MDGKTIRILLVDDDAEYVAVIRHYLRPFQNNNFEIEWRCNCDEAIEYIKSNVHVDLILIDYFSPKREGIEFIRKIYGDKPDVPIVILTSNKDFRTAIEAMKYGVEDYLIKEEATGTILPRTISNVIERVDLKKHLNAAEKEKLITQKKIEAVQELVVTMCHEFNNPLAAIKISTDILMRQSITDRQKGMLTSVNNHIANLEKQIIKLRDLNIEKNR